MAKFSGYKISCVTTAWMGSCWCGDCCCNIFADGSIQYIGEYKWQQSEQFFPTFGLCEGRVRDLNDVENREMRSYYSNLKYSDYKKALLRAYNNPASFKGSDDDWNALQEIVSKIN